MNHTLDKVSIIVPVYNEKHFLSKCVDSIINQTYKNLEIILVDDGSDSTTANMCDDIKQKDSRIIVVHKQNGGLSSARLTGLSLATGDWISFVDNDDLIDADIIMSFMCYSNDASVDVICGGRKDFVSDDEIVFESKAHGHYILSGKEIVEKIPEDNQKTIVTPLWGKIYRRDFLLSLDVSKYKEKCPTIFFEDVLITPIMFYKAKKVCVVEKVFYYHREVPTSISRSGLITSFYFDQIYAGDIVLDFCKLHNCCVYYGYKVVLYIDSIIRIWSLMKKNDKSFFDKTRVDIRNYFKKYKKDYLHYERNSFVKRTMVRSFSFMPHLTGVLLKTFYFKKR